MDKRGKGDTDIQTLLLAPEREKELVSFFRKNDSAGVLNGFCAEDND